MLIETILKIVAASLIQIQLIFIFFEEDVLWW